MPILSSSLAVAKGAGVNLQSNTPVANVIPRNIVIIGTFNPSLAAGITAETVYGPYASSSAIGTIFGNGYMIHRLAIGVFAGIGYNGGASVYVIPQAEVGGAAATSTTIAITGPATAAGSLNLYVDNIKYAVSVASGDSATTIAGNAVTLMTADPTCPCSATNSSGNLSLTSLSKGPWGNSIPVAVNIIAGDSLPTGVTVVVTALSGGTGVPVLANALANGLGSGGASNTLPSGQWCTDMVHGYLATADSMTVTTQDQTTTTAISTYNGPSTAATGCYDHTVGKPFRCFNGDNTNSATLPSALTTYATTNMTDRTDILISVPGSRTHPCEIAATAAGICAYLAAQRAEAPYMDQLLPGVEPGPSNPIQWATSYSIRDTAVKGGVSPVVVRGGGVYLQNVVTYYACNTGITQTSNGYREACNISKIQNITASMLATFRGPKWTGVTVVLDTARVTNPVDRQMARSADDVLDELIGLVYAWEAQAWLYSRGPSLAALTSTVSPAVTVRTAGDGFTASFPGILSGVGNIIDITFNFDISVVGVTS